MTVSSYFNLYLPNVPSLSSHECIQGKCTLQFLFPGLFYGLIYCKMGAPFFLYWQRSACLLQDCTTMKLEFGFMRSYIEFKVLCL